MLRNRINTVVPISASHLAQRANQNIKPATKCEAIMHQKCLPCIPRIAGVGITFGLHLDAYNQNILSHRGLRFELNGIFPERRHGSQSIGCPRSVLHWLREGVTPIAFFLSVILETPCMRASSLCAIAVISGESGTFSVHLFRYNSNLLCSLCGVVARLG